MTAKELFGAIRATAAFSILWRAGLGGTSGIDSIYRSILRDGDPGLKVLPLCKENKDGEKGAVSLSGYKRVLWSKFNSKFQGKDMWLQKASKVPIYSNSSAVAKSLLIVASDDAISDPDAAGLDIRGNAGVSPTIESNVWTKNWQYTLEHIAPQSRSLGWETSLYEDASILNRLGNLTLVPMPANNWLNNKSWVHKRLIYRYFSAESPTDSMKIRDQFAAFGLQVSGIADEVLSNTPYMRMCKSVSTYEGEWDVEFIDRRSLRIAELAFERLINWLDPSKEEGL